LALLPGVLVKELARYVCFEQKVFVVEWNRRLGHGPQSITVPASGSTHAILEKTFPQLGGNT
jgi:hypothetical protein